MKKSDTKKERKPQSLKRDKTTKKVAFVAALSETCRVDKACDAVFISRQTAYAWREEDTEFAAAWEKALKIGVTALEDEAHRRAFEGVDEPVFWQGERIETVKKYSDTLAIFLLKAHAPEKYRDNSRVELTGADGGPVELSDADRQARVLGIAALAAARNKKDDNA